MKTILLTGASGEIGRRYYAASRGRRRFVLADVRVPDFEPGDGDRFEQVDLCDRAACERLVGLADVVVHLAAESDEHADSDAVLPANILATTYLLEAAARTGCERFVYASSLQVFQDYPTDTQLAIGAAYRPGNCYGATKCYGETLCMSIAAHSELSVIVLRIGDYEDYGSSGIVDWYDCTAWLSPKDAVQLIDRAVDVDEVDFLIAHGVSNNRITRLDLAETRIELGYEPEDDAFTLFPDAAGNNPP